MFQVGLHFTLPGFLVGFLPWLLLAIGKENYITWVLLGILFLWIIPPCRNARNKFLDEQMGQDKKVVPLLILTIILLLGCLLGNELGYRSLPSVFGFTDWEEKIEDVQRKSSDIQSPEPSRTPQIQAED